MKKFFLKLIFLALLLALVFLGWRDFEQGRQPLAEIAPDWIDPVTGRLIRELLSARLRQGPASPGPS